MKKYTNPEIEIIETLKGADVVTFSGATEGEALVWDLAE